MLSIQNLEFENKKQITKTLELIKLIKNCYSYKNLIELIHTFLKEIGINVKEEVSLLLS